MSVTQPRRTISSGSSFEAAWGYSRAVLVGDTCEVSGTTGFDYATMTIAEGIEAQTRQAFANIAAALAGAGLGLEHLVRVRYLVPHPADWPAVAAVAGEILGATRPAATAMIVALVDPRMKIEIEATAVS
jgi:enamine deaminase RidA (YjgF/YER057c/UK114 family)